MSEETKSAPVSQLRPKTWPVLEMAVTDGVTRGFNRAHKYIDSPTEDDYKRYVVECVMGEISDWFHVDNEP